MPKVKKLEEENGRITWGLDCPGCGELHAIWSGNGPGPTWDFNGNLDSPTFSPSLRVYGGKRKEGVVERCCHSFVRDGKIEFLSDCTHALAGQIVELPEVE